MTMTTPSSPASGGISRLSEVILDPFHAGLFAAGTRSCLGPAPFRHRKKAELHEFLALAQISGRIQPVAANLEDSLQLLFVLRSPVPVMDASGNFSVVEEAHLHLTYREEALRAPQPGYSFIQILLPRGVWLPNVSPATDRNRLLPLQALCLGASLPPGIRVRELVLMCYGALSLQSIQMDAFNPAGIMNGEAADWWQRNLPRIPLTRAPFLSPGS